MIKCEGDKKECTIIGSEENILHELSIICYGLLQAGYAEDEIYVAMMASFDAYKRFDKEEKKEENENIKENNL